VNVFFLVLVHTGCPELMTIKQVAVIIIINIIMKVHSQMAASAAPH